MPLLLVYCLVYRVYFTRYVIGTVAVTSETHHTRVTRVTDVGMIAVFLFCLFGVSLYTVLYDTDTRVS